LISHDLPTRQTVTFIALEKVTASLFKEIFRKKHVPFSLRFFSFFDSASKSFCLLSFFAQTKRKETQSVFFCP